MDQFSVIKQICILKLVIVYSKWMWLLLGRIKLLCFSNAYKCSVFFEDLTPKRPLTWIGALPDALKKAKNKAEAAEILGADVTEESFNNFPGCQDSAANARCYTTLNKQRSVPLDSCDKNLINTSGSETIGDYLCKQVRRWLKKSSSFQADGIKNLKLPFYYSACNGDWTPVTNDGADLYADEPLCCNPDGTFFRCSGEEFNDKCWTPTLELAV